MCECVPVLVILPCEAFDIVLARSDWALLRPLVLVGEHMCLQVFEDSAAFGKRAKSLLTRLVVQLVAAPAFAACARVLRVKGCNGAAPLPMDLSVWVILLRAKIGAYTALLHPCRARALALRGYVG
jgi:hypothetical protein